MILTGNPEKKYPVGWSNSTCRNQSLTFHRYQQIATLLTICRCSSKKFERPPKVKLTHPVEDDDKQTFNGVVEFIPADSSKKRKSANICLLPLTPKNIPFKSNQRRRVTANYWHLPQTVILFASWNERRKKNQPPKLVHCGSRAGPTLIASFVYIFYFSVLFSH